MGNSLSHSNDYEVEDADNVSSNEHKSPLENNQSETKRPRIKGTDYTYDVSDMLKYTSKEIMYCPDADLHITKEDLPVPGAFLVHNLLSHDECKQYIALAESMVFAPSPLRNLDTINSNAATLDSYTQSIRNSERVLFDVPDHIGVTLNRRLLSVCIRIIH